MAGMTLADIDLIEINEAFAAVVLRFMRDMGIDSMEDQRKRRAIAWGIHWAQPGPYCWAQPWTSWSGATCKRR